MADPADPVDDVETVVSAALGELIDIPGVRRAAVALSEGGGRRLRFRATDSDAWCHIDAYDDVPLTAVVRTGEPVLGDLDAMPDRYAGVVARQRSEGTAALAVLALPGRDQPIGGLMLCYDAVQPFDHAQRGRLEAVAARVGAAVRRARAGAARADAHADEAAQAHRATLRLEDDPRAVGRARHFLRELLSAWRVGGDVLDAAELCLSEIVTNAVVHAGTDSLLTVSLEEAVLRVEVRDRGAEADVGVVDDTDPLRVFGRGLQLVDAIADRWGAEHDHRGTRSWFDLEVGSAA
ncbi:ATP-binding protein [Nocardioides sp.]|uniref:ATP-binding protein n=1 Tax=Nocardioides sp. TaxID=35761 RepID=UPI0037830144